MSIYRTYKAVERKGTINGKNYELVAYMTYYNAYSSLHLEGLKYADAEEAKDIELTFKKGAPLNSSAFTDNYGNIWYKGETLYIAFANGIALNSVPTSYYEVCQLISKDANLVNPDMVSGYDYCYNKLTKCLREYFAPMIEGEYVRDFDTMFTTDFKVGDRVFYVVHKDRDTRCGERLQIEMMTIKDIAFCGDGLYLFNHNSKQGYLTYGDVYRPQNRCAKSVEELCKIYPNEYLYMWHRNGRVAIEECHSTELFLRYNGKDYE